MDKGFENVHESLNQAFEKISENMEAKEKVNTIFEILKQTKNKKTLTSKHKRESILA